MCLSLLASPAKPEPPRLALRWRSPFRVFRLLRKRKRARRPRTLLRAKMPPHPSTPRRPSVRRTQRNPARNGASRRRSVQAISSTSPSPPRGSMPRATRSIPRSAPRTTRSAEKRSRRQPLGSNASLSTTLLQAPGVAQDSFGQLHVRGDHANLQYRINGVIIPETISGFSQLFDTRFARRIDLITGALPAEYGYRTAGVVDIETRSGTLEPGGEVVDLRRAAADFPAELLLWRLDRQGRLLRYRKLSAEQYRHRKSDPFAQSGEGFQRAGQGFPLSFGHHRREYALELHLRHGGEPIPASQQPGTDPRPSRPSAFRISTPRVCASSNSRSPISIFFRCRNLSAISTSRSPCSTDTR